MLRTLFVLAIILLGAGASLKSPFNALLFYLWNAYFRPEDWVGADWVSSLHLSLIIYVFILGAVLIRHERPRWSLRLGLLVGFGAQALFSTLLSENVEYSWAYFDTFAKTVLLCTIIVALVNDTDRFRKAFLAIALSLGLEAAKQGWVLMVLHPGSTNANPHPVLGDNNGVALGMMMLVPLLAVLAATATRFWERGVHGAMAVGAIARGLSTYSRGGFLALGGIGLVWFARSRQKLRAVVALVLLGSAMYFIMPPAFWARMQTINESSDNRDDSALGRLHFWDTATTMAASNPLAGVGFNAFPQAYDKYDASNGAFGSSRAVHSVWFGLLAELGYPGPILFAMLLLCALTTCWRTRRLAKHDPEAAAALLPYAMAIETSLLAFVVAGSFLSWQYNEFLWHMIAFSIALDELYRRALERSLLAHAPAPAPTWHTAGPRPQPQTAAAF